MYNRRDDGVSPVIGTLLVLALIAVLAAIVIPVAITTFTDFSVQEKKTVGVTVNIDETDGMSLNLSNGRDKDELTEYKVIVYDTNGALVSEDTTYTVTSRNPVVRQNIPLSCEVNEAASVTVVGTFADGHSDVVFQGNMKPGIVVVPVEDEKTVTIYLDYNYTGGPAKKKIENQPVKKAIMADSPVREFYSFTGWYTEETGGTRVTRVSEDMNGDTLYAHWSATERTITLDNQGADSAGAASIKVNGDGSIKTEYASISIPTKTGQIFGGYYTGKDGSGTCHIDGSGNWAGTSVASSVDTLYAKWTINTYSVTFSLQDHVGTAPTSQNVAYGGKVTKPSTDPSDDAYDFKGWYHEAECTQAWDFANDTVTGVTTIYAKWEIKTYSVTYHSGAGSDISGSVQGGTKTHGVDYTLSMGTFTRTGYTQTGWALSDGGIKAYNLGDTYTKNESVGLYPVWTKKAYTVTFNANGHGTAPNQQTISHGDTAAKPDDLTAEGWTFGGWYTEGSTTPYDFSTAVTSSFTLYAKWTQITYTVTYSPGAKGSGSIAAGTKVHGTAYTVTSSKFTRANYTQTGWALTDGGEKAYDFGASYTENAAVTLYPVWEGNTLTITFIRNENNINGKTVGTNQYEITSNTPGGPAQLQQTFTAGEETVLNDHTFSVTANYKAGRTAKTAVAYMIGWNTAANGSGTSYTNRQAVTFEENVTLYAQWAVCVYEITLNNSGSTSVIYIESKYTETDSGSVFNPKSYPQLPVPTKTGNVFTGWWTASSGGTQITDATGKALPGQILSESTTSKASDREVWRKTLYAHWASSYTVILYGNGGSPDSLSYDVAVNENFSFADKTNSFTRTGFSLGNWNERADGSGTSHGLNSSVTSSTSGTTLKYYAQWSSDNCDVIFYRNHSASDTTNETRSYSPNIDHSLPTDVYGPPSTTYSFVGWNTARNGSGTWYTSINMPKGAELTLYAQWAQKIKLSFAWNKGGADLYSGLLGKFAWGIEEMDDQEFKAGVSEPINKNVFSLTGHTGFLQIREFNFLGWATTGDSTSAAVVFADEARITITYENSKYYAAGTDNVKHELKTSDGKPVLYARWAK